MSEEARQKADPNPRFQLYTVEELEKLSDPTWLIDGVVPQGGLTELYGTFGAGKSFLALDWSLSVATGISWLGRELNQGDVVYVSAEGRSGLKKRIAAWRAQHPSADLGRIRFLPQPVNLLDQGDVNALIEAIKQPELDLGFVVIDTLARCFGDGDENATRDMSLFVKGADQIKTAFQQSTVLVVHHSGKDANRGDRGSTALRGAADTVMKLVGKAEQKPMTLKCEKQKDSESFTEIKLTLREEKFENGETSCVVAAKEGPVSSKEPVRNKNDMKALVALRTFDTEGAIYTEWLKKSGLVESTFKNARKRLLRDDLIDHDDKRYQAKKSKEGQGQGQGKSEPLAQAA